MGKQQYVLIDGVWTEVGGGGGAGGMDQTAADARYVNTAGDTVSGNLTVNGNMAANSAEVLTAPTLATHVSPKSYVDARTPQITVSDTQPSNPSVDDIWIDKS